MSGRLQGHGAGNEETHVLAEAFSMLSAAPPRIYPV